jgi:hypothetical protein
MPYDLFISYSRCDNERGQVAALKAQIESSFRTFAGRDLRVFFDTHEIAGMDDWRQKIQRSLRDSQVFLAVLSPKSLFGNSEGRCGEGLWLWTRRRGRSIPAAGL